MKPPGSVVHPGESTGSISLADLPTGAGGVVRQMLGGQQLSARLAALGLTLDALVTILHNYGHGPVIIAVRGTRVALGRGEALKIQVERQ